MTDRSAERDAIIAEVVVLNARKKAFEKLIEERRARLYILMKETGDTVRSLDYGVGRVASRRKFQIHDRKKLWDLLSEDVLRELVQIDAAAYDAAKDAGIDIDSAVTVVPDENVRVERRRTKAETERAARIMEETKTAMEARIRFLAEKMQQRREVVQ